MRLPPNAESGRCSAIDSEVDRRAAVIPPRLSLGCSCLVAKWGKSGFINVEQHRKNGLFAIGQWPRKGLVRSQGSCRSPLFNVT